MSRLGLAALLLGVLAFLPARAATLLCAPVALAEQQGEPGPLTIPASDTSLGNPILFWVDTATGDLQEHAEGGDRFITREAKLVKQGADGDDVFLGRDEEQDELYRIDLGVSLHPFQRSVNGALTTIGACVPAAMGVLPEEDEAPVWPFSYKRG